MFTRPIRFALLLNCALAALTCCEVRGGLVEAGTDDVAASTAVFTLDITSPLIGPFTETISLSSVPFQIIRQQQVGTTIDTEIDDLTLTGLTSGSIPVTVRIGSSNSLGPVQEGSTVGTIQSVVASGTGVVPRENFQYGYSSFDVLFEVDFNGLTLYNTDPHVLATDIFELPPLGSVHLPPIAPGYVDLRLRQGLFNSPFDPIVGQAVGSHTLQPDVPEPLSLALLGIGCVGLVGCRRRRRSHNVDLKHWHL